jgi:hypothetical protein
MLFYASFACEFNCLLIRDISDTQR